MYAHNVENVIMSNALANIILLNLNTIFYTTKL